MSESIKKVEVFKENTIINIDVSVQFHHRLQTLFVWITEQFKTEDLKLAVDKIKTGQPLQPLEEHLETILILINTIEEKARVDNNLTFQDITIGDS